MTTTDRAVAGLDEAVATVRANLAPFATWWPGDTTTDGTYLPRRPADGGGEGENTGWTTSFWTGQVWLAWQLTGDDVFREVGTAHVADFARRMREHVGVDTHDLGFLYTLSSVVPWRLLGDEEARAAALAAADHLMTRFLEPAGIVQAWGDVGEAGQHGRTIIDSLMNMPLLYWASEQTGDPRYERAARRHTAQLRDHMVRADGTTFHTFHWDPVSGEALRGTTAQGFHDGSCWARGQAWGVYGFAMAHRFTGDPSFRETAVTLADYFLDHLPADRVCAWDLVFTDDPTQPRDSSAAAIVVNGLVELADALDADPATAPSAARYREAADEILDALVAGYATVAGEPGTALLEHAVYDLPKGNGVDEGCLWGDYYYLEALMRRARPDWVTFW